MSNEGFKFRPCKQPKFPCLVMRAFSAPDDHAEWILTPPEGAGWFDYKFEACMENGKLFINFDSSIMTPREPE